jgi:hypothetical protein
MPTEGLMHLIAQAPYRVNRVQTIESDNVLLPYPIIDASVWSSVRCPACWLYDATLHRKHRVPPEVKIHTEGRDPHVGRFRAV